MRELPTLWSSKPLKHFVFCLQQPGGGAKNPDSNLSPVEEGLLLEVHHPRPRGNRKQPWSLPSRLKNLSNVPLDVPKVPRRTF